MSAFDLERIDTDISIDTDIDIDTGRGGAYQRGPSVHEYRLLAAGRPVGHRAALRALADDAAARQVLLASLISAPFAAYKWETPALDTERADREFRFVILDSPSLANRRLDAEPFRRALSTASGPVADFANLGGDAHLVVPVARGDADCTHLASFVRTASKAHQHALIARAATLCLERIGERPLWLSTAGLGVSWLHIRIDQRPKYYGHAPYRE